MNNQGPPAGPVFHPFHFTQQINVRVTMFHGIGYGYNLNAESAKNRALDAKTGCAN